MDLSHEAVICLRPPTATRLPIPPGYRDAGVSFLTGQWRWCPVFSTLPLSKYDRTPPRDPHFRFQIDVVSNTYTMTETWIDPDDKPDPLEVHARPRVLTTKGKVLDVQGDSKDVAQLRVSNFQQEDTGRKWEVISWGKQGQLENWMIEDDSGLISDSSGEARPDWRNWYVVVYYEATAEKEAGIEVWDSIGRSRRLTDLTYRKIQDAIRSIKDSEFSQLADKLVKIM